MKTSDRKILNQLRKGDIKSFESLFHRFHPGLVLYAGSILKDTDLAGETVQEVFYQIWKNRNRINLHKNWKNYLYGAVYKQCLMEIRKQKKQSRLDDYRINQSPVNISDPAQELIGNELNEVITQTLDALPDRTREIFNLSRVEGLRYREIAQKLTISVKTVEANMAKALKAFRMSLREFGY